MQCLISRLGTACLACEELAFEPRVAGMLQHGIQIHVHLASHPGRWECIELRRRRIGERIVEIGKKVMFIKHMIIGNA